MMFSVVLKALPPVEIGAAMRLKALIIMFGPAIGPTLSGMLLGVFSWRAIFFTFTLALAVAALAASRAIYFRSARVCFMVPAPFRGFRARESALRAPPRQDSAP